MQKSFHRQQEWLLTDKRTTAIIPPKKKAPSLYIFLNIHLIKTVFNPFYTPSEAPGKKPVVESN